MNDIFHTIYLDLDGPCSNFNLEAIRAHLRVGKQFKWLQHHGTPLELTEEHLNKVYPLGESASKVICNLSGPPGDYWQNSGDYDVNQFWHPIRLDPLFWHNMPAFSWAYKLIAMLRVYCKHLVICTTPDTHANSYAGKFHWLHKRGLGDLELIMMKHKWRLADRECLLIDDNAKHIESYNTERRKRFGSGVFNEGAILFPCISNQNHPYLSNPVAYVESEIKRLLS